MNAAARGQGVWALAVAAAGVLAFAHVLLAYRTSPAVAAIALGAVVAAVVVASRPILGIYLAMLVVPLDLFQLEQQSSTDNTLRFSATEVAMGLTAAAALAHFLLGRRRALHPAHLAFLGLVAVSALGLVFATDTDVVWRITAFWLAAVVASVLVASATPRELEHALVCLALAGGVVGVVAIVGTGPQEVSQGGEVVTGRATGTFAQSNVLAFYIILALAPAIALMSRGSPGRRTLMGACVGAMVLGLALTLSRGGIIGAAASLLALLAWPPFRRRVALATFFVVVFSIINIGAIQGNRQVQVVTERFGTLTSGQVAESNTRLTIYARTPALIADYPVFGVGAGNYPDVSARYGLRQFNASPYEHPHNLLLTIAAELGLIGLALFLIFIWRVGKAAARALRARDPVTFPLALGVTSALVGLFVSSLVEYPLRTSTILAALMIEVGVIIGYERAAYLAAAPAQTARASLGVRNRGLRPLVGPPSSARE